MSASPTSVLDFVRDMERNRVPPFRQAFWDDIRIQGLASCLRDAACAEDAKPVASCIKDVRQERLWHLKKWLTFRYKRHPRIDAWVHEQLGMRPC